MRKFVWHQGEHVTLIGPTGQGKTTLAKAILPRRTYVDIFVTKKRDALIDDFKNDGYVIRTKWEPLPPDIEPRVLLKPPFAKDEPKERFQRNVFKEALDAAFDEGGRTIYIDELPYIIEELGLKRQTQRLWYQGRSLKVSVVSSAQRPAWLPLLAYSSATHLFFFRTTDSADLQRLGGLGGVDNRLIQAEVAVLQSHQVLYLNTRTGQMYKTKVE